MPLIYQPHDTTFEWRGKKFAVAAVERIAFYKQRTTLRYLFIPVATAHGAFVSIRLQERPKALSGRVGIVHDAILFFPVFLLAGGKGRVDRLTTAAMALMAATFEQRLRRYEQQIARLGGFTYGEKFFTPDRRVKLNRSGEEIWIDGEKRHFAGPFEIQLSGSEQSPGRVLRVETRVDSDVFLHLAAVFLHLRFHDIWAG